MSYIGKNKVSVLTVGKREQFLRRLSEIQINVLYTYRKWLWASKFQTNIIGDTKWIFVGYKEDPNYNIHLGNSNTLHCECERGIKYQFEIRSIDGEQSRFLGRDHLSQHLGISQQVVKEIISKNNKVQYDIDRTLERYFSGQRFPRKLYENYMNMGCISKPLMQFDQKLLDFSRADFPLNKNEKLRMKKRIIEMVEKDLEYKSSRKLVRISTIAKKMGLENRTLVEIGQKNGFHIKTHSSSLSQDEVSRFLSQIDFNSIKSSKADTKEQEIYGRESIIKSFDFPVPPFDGRIINLISDIIYETVQWEKKVLIDDLLKEFKNFYNQKNELDEFEESVNLNKIIENLVTTEDVYQEGNYLISDKPLTEEISEQLTLFSEETSQLIKETYKALMPERNISLTDKTYLFGYILRVMIEEAPIHKQFIKSRIRKLMGENYDNYRYNLYLNELKDKGIIHAKNNFWYIEKSIIDVIRINDGENPFNRRKSDYISEEELGYFILCLRKQNKNLSLDQVISVMEYTYNIPNISSSTAERIRKIYKKSTK